MNEQTSSEQGEGVVTCEWCGATTPSKDWRCRFVRLGEKVMLLGLRFGASRCYAPIICPDCVQEAQASL